MHWLQLRLDRDTTTIPQRFDYDTIRLSVYDCNNGEGELRGQPANPGSPGKMAVKTECVCVCVCVYDCNMATTQLQLNCTIKFPPPACDK